MQVEFTNYRKSEAFVKWLIEKRKADSMFKLLCFESDDRNIGVQKSVPDEQKISEISYRLTWTSYDAGVSQASENKEAIIFLVEESHTGESSITATCNYKPVLPYFEYLLAECGQTSQKETRT